MPALPSLPSLPSLPEVAALPEPPVGADAFVRGTRIVAVGALLAMIALGLAWELWLAPTGQRTLVLKVLPLLVPLSGLLKLRLYTYRWVSLLVWLYFTEGVVRATSGGGLDAALAWGQTLLCLLLFMACAAHVRHRLRARPVAAPTA